MDRNKKEVSGYDAKLVAEFMKRGGEITICEPHARTENIEYTGGAWGKRKKKAEPTPPVTPPATGDKT